MTATVVIARTAPKTVDAVGVPVATTGTVPRSLGLNRAALAAVGFEGKPGQTLVVPSGTGPAQIAVGTVVSELSTDPRGIVQAVFCCFSEQSAKLHAEVAHDLDLA